MRRARSQLGHLRLLLPLLLLSQAASLAVAAERPRLVVRDAGACGEVAGRYVALLEEPHGLVVSAAAFPGGSPIGTARGGKLEGELPGYGRVELRVEPEGEVHGIVYKPAASPAPVGCVAFDKDRFTWASDLLTYVRYLADELLAAAQRIDPSRASLEVRDRKVRMEVSRPGQDRAVLEGTEGAMLGYGQTSDPVRYFFIPVLLDGEGQSVLVRVLRNEGTAFGAKATQPLGWAMIEGDEPVTTDTQPQFQIRVLVHRDE